MINKLDYEGITNFLFQKKIIVKLKRICINVFCYESGLTYPMMKSSNKSAS